MVAVNSTMLPLGTPLPEFRLQNAVDSRQVGSHDGPAAPGTLVMFICNHCPYVIHIRKELVRFANDAVERGLQILAINANSELTHPQDGPSNMRKLATEEGWRFPFLFDASQAVAKTFRAACTPEFYLFDGARKLVYRGQFDDSRPSAATPVTGKDLRAAVEAVLAGKAVPAQQRPSMGCNIKWAPGNAPGYFG